MSQTFIGATTTYRDLRLPERAIPVGYAALVDAYQLDVPLPRELCAIGPRHKVYDAEGWRIFTPRHEPTPTLEGHLVFALKYEGLDLAVLKRLFQQVSVTDLQTMIASQPTSTYFRRIWFLYEWLLGIRLDIDDATSGPYADIVDTKLQWGVRGTTVSRYRVRNNLPGTREFCPLVRKTPALANFVASQLGERARAITTSVSQDVLARTAAFLLLKDSKSSYVIEGESPPQSRIQRWGQAIGEAGKRPLDSDELLRLQRIVIGDARFVRLGLRHEGGFVGEHDRLTRLPLPAHISARAEDLPSLLAGLVDFEKQFSDELDPVMGAAVLAFGFVYIHPFADGNGRLHRYLIHHVLAAQGFNPPGIVFPISSAILDRIDDYRRVLESYSKRLLPCIDWEPTPLNNVRVLNDTADFYRYFDATEHAEFLFECVEKTIEVDWPEEAAYLESYDAFKRQVAAIVDMPASTLDLLCSFLRQNHGELSARARANEFAALTPDEVHAVESAYGNAFASRI